MPASLPSGSARLLDWAMRHWQWNGGGGGYMLCGISRIVSIGIAKHKSTTLATAAATPTKSKQCCWEGGKGAALNDAKHPLAHLLGTTRPAWHGVATLLILQPENQTKLNRNEARRGKTRRQCAISTPCLVLIVAHCHQCSQSRLAPTHSPLPFPPPSLAAEYPLSRVLRVVFVRA